VRSWHYCRKGVAPTREFWVRASECWSAELNARIERLEQMRDRFTECIGCGCLAFKQCALVNPGDKLGQDGPGPRRLFNEWAPGGSNPEPAVY
jgi:MerR family redox-sensitive transcriptional activator SoxR